MSPEPMMQSAVTFTAWAALFTLFGVIVRQIGPWRGQSIDAAAKIRGELTARVDALEKSLERSEARRIRDETRHDAERTLYRHRLNNMTQCFDAMLMLIETSPEKASEIVVKIKEMRAAQVRAEAQEKAVIHAAAVLAATEQDEMGKSAALNAAERTETAALNTVQEVKDAEGL